MLTYTNWGRTRSACYFCFYQQKIEWIGLKETHPDLYLRKREYDPFTVGFIPPHQMHSIAASSSGMRAFSMEIAPQWLERMSEHSSNVGDAVHCKTGAIAQLHTKFPYEFQSKDEALPLAVEGMALEMLTHVLPGCAIKAAGDAVALRRPCQAVDS